MAKSAGTPEKRKCEEYPAKDLEVHAEEAEGGTVAVSEAAGDEICWEYCQFI